jgi:Domain of unknown function (DUF4262)
VVTVLSLFQGRSVEIPGTAISLVRCGLITVGLPPETAHFALNEAAELLRAGVDLTKGRHGQLVGQVDCEFRPVDQKWTAQLMGWAVWYYDGADFPCAAGGGSRSRMPD